ncbi:MAG: TetR/AcrR family transcriptional regulator [Pseudomonadota bacterium]
MSSVNLKRRAEIGRERREKTRRRLIAAAARVIVDRGEERATIDDFIQAANVSRGTFYNYYSTREEIVEELWATIGKDPFKQIARWCEQIDGAAEQLTTFSRLVIRQAKHDEVWGWLIYAMSKDQATVNQDLRDFPTMQLERGLSEGKFKIDNLESARDFVVNVIRETIRVNLIEDCHGNYTDAIYKMLLAGLGVSRKDASRLIQKPLPDL